MICSTKWLTHISSVFLFVLLLFLYSCDKPPLEPNGPGSPITSGIVEVEFNDIPESLLEPRDPAIEAEEAEGSFLENLGFGLVAVNIDSPESLAEMGLEGVAEKDQPFLSSVLKTITAGLVDATYVFLFEPDTMQVTLPQLLGPDDLPLVSITRVDRTVPTCTTVVSTQAEDGEDAVGYGGRIGALTEGICGGIAVLHSWIELGATTQAKATNGNNFKKKAIDTAQGSNKKKMSHKFLKKQHEKVGATDCRTRPGAGVTTSNRQGLNQFTQDLSRLVNDPNNTWDCTLFVRTKGRNGDVLAHFEHINSVTSSGNNISINTINGFSQGNSSMTVPYSPGINTWTATPGGAPAFKLTSTTSTRPRILLRGTPNVGIANYLCCKAP